MMPSAYAACLDQSAAGEHFAVAGTSQRLHEKAMTHTRLAELDLSHAGQRRLEALLEAASLARAPFNRLARGMLCVSGRGRGCYVCCVVVEGFG